MNERIQAKATLEAAEAIMTRAKAAGRPTTADERAEAKQLIEKAQDLRSNAEIIDAIDGMHATGRITEAGDRFFKAITDARFDLRANPSVEVPLAAALYKAPTLPAVTDLGRTTPFVSPLGQDGRFLHTQLQTEDAGDAMSVQFFRQTGSRTVTGTVERALTATTDKATLGLTLTLVNSALVQEAVLIDAIPNAVLEDVSMTRDFFESEGRFQIAKALDSHVFAAIVAAAPPFGTSGTTLVDKIRNGIATMRATGFNPDIVVLNPTDAASLDLTADAGGYIFPTRDTGSSSPLWGLRVVERIGAGTEPPYLIDTANIGKLFLGRLQIQADPFAGLGTKNFAKNLTDLRFEIKCLMAVRQAEAARRIAAT